MWVSEQLVSVHAFLSTSDTVKRQWSNTKTATVSNQNSGRYWKCPIVTQTPSTSTDNVWGFQCNWGARGSFCNRKWDWAFKSAHFTLLHYWQNGYICNPLVILLKRTIMAQLWSESPVGKCWLVTTRNFTCQHFIIIQPCSKSHLHLHKFSDKIQLLNTGHKNKKYCFV